MIMNLMMYYYIDCCLMYYYILYIIVNMGTYLKNIKNLKKYAVAAREAPDCCAVPQT